MPAPAPPSSGPLGATETSTAVVRAASRTAGVGLLLMAALAGVGYGLAVQGLITPGNATRTAADVLASEDLFRLGVVALVAVVALDVVVAWALYRVFLPAGPERALLAAVFRWVYSAVFLVAIGRLVAAVDLLAGDRGPRGIGTQQVENQALLAVGEFEATWNAGLALFAVHLLLVGSLAYRSGFAPRWLGVLLVLAGLGYLFDSVAAVLSGGSWPTVAQFTFLGEVLLALWLLVHARRLRTPAG